MFVVDDADIVCSRMKTLRPWGTGLGHIAVSSLFLRFPRCSQRLAVDMMSRNKPRDKSRIKKPYHRIQVSPETLGEIDYIGPSFDLIGEDFIQSDSPKAMKNVSRGYIQSPGTTGVSFVPSERRKYLTKTRQESRRRHTFSKRGCQGGTLENQQVAPSNNTFAGDSTSSHLNHTASWSPETSNAILLADGVIAEATNFPTTEVRDGPAVASLLTLISSLAREGCFSATNGFF